MLPLKLAMVYLLGTFVLFLIWPVNWQLYHWTQWLLLSAYVIVAYALIAFGFAMGRRGPALPSLPLPTNRIIIAGAALAILLLIPSSYIYTGRPPWEVLDALSQQGDAYRRFQQQLQQEGDRSGFALLRAVVAPLTFAAVPLAILHWRRLSWSVRGLAIGAAMSSLIFGTLRGTDREMAEIFIIGGSAFLVVWGRSADARRSLASAFARYWKVGAVAAVFLVIAASLFTERKAERLGRIDTVCANDSRICADVDAPAISWMGERAKFSVSIFILSSCSGYYGLALGMEKDFKSTFGLGHSAYALRAYEIVTGDRSLQERTYTYRNTFDGWSPDYYWSTAFLWFANDVGFAGALIVVALFAALWGRSWRDATIGHSDAAAIIFCAMMLMFMQLASTTSILNALDGYITLGVWLFAWARQRVLAWQRSAGARLGES